MFNVDIHCLVTPVLTSYNWLSAMSLFEQEVHKI